MSDDEILCRLDPGPFAGGYPDLGVICHLGCVEAPCAHTYELLADLNGWSELRAPLAPAPALSRVSDERSTAVSPPRIP